VLSYHLHRPKNMDIILAKKLILATDTSKFSHISEEEIQGYVPMMVSPIVRIAATEGIFFVFMNWFPIKLGMSSNISF